MFNLLKKIGRHGVKPTPRRLGFDRLEDRTVPTLFAGASHVNTTTALAQHHSVTASSHNGSRVVVWVHDVSATGSQLRAQLYNAAGAKIGPERALIGGLTFVANPAVCMDNLGRFYVSYTRETSPSNRDVVVARFSNTGNFLGALFAASSVKNEYDSSIACDGAGAYTVSYTIDTTSTNQDVYARRFTSTGVFLGVMPVAVSPLSDETASAVAVRNIQPAFISVVFAVQNKDVYHKRYHPTGFLVGAMHSVAVSPLTETNPSVAVDVFGTAVVAFQQHDGNDWNIRARKVSVGGSMSTTFMVQGGGASDTDPTVAMDYSEGDFVVAYQSHQFAGNIVRVMATEVTTTGLVQHNYVSTNALTTATRPSVTINAADRFIVSFAANGIVGDPSLGILARFGVR